ncbi:MAG: molybdopterin molybdotransferase MoeA [Oscillospiraceae bacterium]|nr:molybdopterin molybdotransferase MoeA [Oscillospiraceae bacterium]
MQKDIDADSACALLLECQTEFTCETVDIQSALYRVATKDVAAKIPVPPFSRSPFDGYVFRGEDTQSATRENPAVLKIVEEIPAGVMPTTEISPGTAAKILTGAPIPPEADATIKYELTEFTDSEVRIFDPVSPGRDIVKLGADVMPGEIICPKGEVITATQISSFANQGFLSVEVYRKPQITVISTGTELREAGDALPPAAIYNSNVYTLMAYLQEVGANPINGGIVPDDEEAIARKLRQALNESDMVITTGGASVGDYDYAIRSAELLGAEILFWKVLMKPGGAIMAARVDGKVLLSLSGNPAAAVIGLLRIAMPYIKKLCGRREVCFPEVNVKLRKPFTKSSGEKTRILRGRLEIIDSIAFFNENYGQESEKITTFLGCDLLAEIPLGSPPLEIGANIKAYRV